MLYHLYEVCTLGMDPVYGMAKVQSCGGGGGVYKWINFLCFLPKRDTYVHTYIRTVGTYIRMHVRRYA